MNGYGKKLIEVCRIELRIANGRVLGDLNGKFNLFSINKQITVEFPNSCRWFDEVALQFSTALQSDDFRNSLKTIDNDITVGLVWFGLLGINVALAVFQP